MKIKMSDVLAYMQTYKILSAQKLPIKVTYSIMKINSLLEKDHKFYETEFQSIIQDGAERDENGNVKLDESGLQVILQKDKIEEVTKKLNELLELEVEVDDIKIDINLLDGMIISATELKGLEPFIG